MCFSEKIMKQQENLFCWFLNLFKSTNMSDMKRSEREEVTNCVLLPICFFHVCYSFDYANKNKKMYIQQKYHLQYILLNLPNPLSFFQKLNKHNQRMFLFISKIQVCKSLLEVYTSYMHYVCCYVRQNASFQIK